MARRVGPPKVGYKKPPMVAKIRRTQKQAYGSRSDWTSISRTVKHRDNHCCRLCGSTQFLQVDHIIPVSKGGKTVVSNLWTLCDICHSKRPGHKTARHLILHKRNKVAKYLTKHNRKKKP